MTRTDSSLATLAEWVGSVDLESIPAEALTAARLVVLDTIGVALGGSEAEEVQRLAGDLGSGTGPATIIGTDRRAPAAVAALVNGTSSTWLDFDSGHVHPPGTPLLPAGHMPVHVLPAALATAERVGSSGRDLLAAFVTGYDVAARVGVSSRLRIDIHPHGTYPSVGAAAAVARLRGLDPDGIAAAMAIALGLTIVPSFENGYQGKSVRNAYAGHGARIGVLATDLVLAGVVPERDPIGTVFGSIVSPTHDPELLLEDLGTRWECTRGYLKPFPSVRYGHPAIEAAESLRDAVDAGRIDRVLVETYDLPATLDERRPTSELGAKFSLPWAVASMLVRGRAGPDEFRTLDDEAVRAVAAVVDVVEDPAMTARTPGDRPARVTVVAGDEEATAEVDRSAGGPDAPMGPDAVTTKFRSLADRVIGAEAAGTVAEQVLGLESVDDVRRLARLLASPESGAGGLQGRDLGDGDDVVG